MDYRPEPGESEPYAAGNRKISTNSSSNIRHCFHLGILIFAPFLNKLQAKGLHYIRQWVVAVLLGCQNIEQSKQLNYGSIEAIIGKVPKTLRLQRSALKDSSTMENTKRILQFNAELLEVNRQKDFYYDPHTKHYKGHLKVLATWCSSIRLADKGLNMDYIHSTSGHPVYFSTDDNFYDLRERFLPNIKEFREMFSFDKESVVSWVVDRGIYSMDVFENIINDPYAHIITWEKGYQKNKWDEEGTFKTGSIIKRRNNKNDVRLVHYRYQEKPWDKNQSLKQIIVRVLDKEQKVTIEVSILTDDKDRAADQIIELMFKRWVQENDFKYMIKHFGLNQLTSYAFVDYKSLKDKIEDKLYTCSNHKSLTKEIHKIRAKLKTALLDKYRFDERHQGTDENLSEKDQQRKEKIMNRVNQLNAKLSELEETRRNTSKYISKIDELTEQDYKKLDTNAKNFMDAIKLLARNIFYLSFQSFKDKYDNYRDDHLLFRHLTQSPGTIEQSKDNIIVGLTPQMEYQPKIRKIISEVLNEINQNKPQLADGTNRNIELFLKN